MGFLGVGPEGIRVGDWVCWLKGWKTAFVLRKGDDKVYQSYFELVGECFVSALYDMDEDNQFRVNMDSEPEIFTIR